MSEQNFDLFRAELSGKVVLVTGGGSGIGAAIAEAFWRQGARVAIHYHHSDKQDISALAQRICAAGGEALSLQADFGSSPEVTATVAKAIAHFGRLDILVNNAGSMIARRTLEEVDDDFIEQVFALNARSVVTACRAALPIFTLQGAGCIINVSSISARTGGSPGSSIYSASKAFVSTLTRSLARELAERNIRVNAISPGTIDTAFHELFSNREKLEKTRVGIPLQRLGEPNDCAGTALYLACPSLSGYVTGQVIEINGGQLMA
ncbi:SDR family NAD(P)-dependent oxidoreductase [Geopsychrobacter electrodiphilus]|uniref:SDR family NAD(P)-dependent oxidoreductase n=1 Tax=Geopsychrobacter electrodiphilus TaxID=225196 RepID=UPI00037CE8EF|nr:glucose 1-dehydrogenase [Geopsychrobacter electrodiphilus]